MIYEACAMWLGTYHMDALRFDSIKDVPIDAVQVRRGEVEVEVEGGGMGAGVGEGSAGQAAELVVAACGPQRTCAARAGTAGHCSSALRHMHVVAGSAHQAAACFVLCAPAPLPNPQPAVVPVLTHTYGRRRRLVCSA
jgi:hypothetical protein